MTETERLALVEDITRRIGDCFRTFGGGRDSEWNPLTHALKDRPMMFAAGVDVASVVSFVLRVAEPVIGARAGAARRAAARHRA